MDKKVKQEYSRSVKRGMIEICCEFPILIACAIGFYFLKLPDWLSILLTVCVGLIVFIIIEIIAFKIDLKKKAVEAKQPKKFDPFAD